MCQFFLFFFNILLKTPYIYPEDVSSLLSSNRAEQDRLTAISKVGTSEWASQGRCHKHEHHKDAQAKLMQKEVLALPTKPIEIQKTVQFHSTWKS